MSIVSSEVSEEWLVVNRVMRNVKKLNWPALRIEQIEEGESPDCVFMFDDDDMTGSRMKDEVDSFAITPAIATLQVT